MPNPWEKRPGETIADYTEFLLWLDAPRPRPTPDCLAAGVWAWADRARAWDEAQAPPTDPVKATRADLWHLVALESKKHLAASRASAETRLRPLELARLVAVLERLPEGLGGDGEGDLSKLSTEELEALDAALVKAGVR